MTKEDCVFCKIMDGKMPSAIVYEDDEFRAILDRFPASPGHVLIICKEHIENIFELLPEKAGRMFQLTVKIAAVVKKQLKCDGINILQNNGEAAGQSVPHFHIHIIPRYNHDKMNIPWKAQNPTDEDIVAMRDRLSIGLNIE